MGESAAKPADSLGKERGSLGDREVMRFMAMARQPGNPTDSPRLAPLFSGWLCPHPFRSEPLMTSRGEGPHRGDMEALTGTAFVTIRQYWGGGGIEL